MNKPTLLDRWLTGGAAYPKTYTHEEYKALELALIDVQAQRDALRAALRAAVVKLDVRVQNASGGDSITEAENIMCAAIAAAEKGQ